MRSGSISLVVLASMGALAALTLGCQNRSDLAAWSRSTLAQAVPTAAAAQQPQPQAPIAVAVPVYAQAPSALAEQPLDTRVVPPPAPAQLPAPPLPTKKPNRSVRTISDEHLPTWVPVTGRLTVVESSDLAENLGLVPVGTTRKTDERISVAEKLAEENASRTAVVRGDPMTRGVSWNYAGANAGRVRNHRF